MTHTHTLSNRGLGKRHNGGAGSNAGVPVSRSGLRSSNSGLILIVARTMNSRGLHNVPSKSTLFRFKVYSYQIASLRDILKTEVEREHI